MSRTFRDAFVWHLEHYPFRLVDIQRATGVTRDVLNKLKSGAANTTAVENALLISRFYGKTIEQFLSLAEPSHISAFENLWLDLTDEERRVVEITMRTLAAQHSGVGAEKD